MKKIIFAYEVVPAFGRLTNDLGKMISVLDNGNVFSVVQMNNKIVSEDVIAKIPGIVLEIKDILDLYKSEIDELPAEIRNGSMEGELHRFTFQEKIVSGCNLSYCDVRNINDCGRYKDAAIYSNRVLDIFNEIVILMNRYCIRHELLREKT